MVDYRWANGSKIPTGKFNPRDWDKIPYGSRGEHTYVRKRQDAVGDPAYGEQPPGGYEERAAVTSNVAGQLGGRRNYDIDPGQAEAYRRMVEQGEMSQYQLDQILGSNSPLMRRAAATGQAMAGQRGLMNSSLAAGAAHGSMIDRAQPFALSDADAYRMAATENLAAKNQASLTNAQLMTQANIAGGELTGAYDRSLLQAKAQAMMEEAQRMWQTGERQDSQGWQTSERIGGQEWQSGENVAQRDWQTGERVGGQNWQSGENQLNRDWTSEENMHQRMQDWATTQLQTYASIGMNREQAMLQVLSSIYSNPNLTSEEQRAAAANAQLTFENLYGKPWVPPQGLSYDPATGNQTNPPPAGQGQGSTAPGGQYDPDRYDWGRHGAAAPMMRENYIKYMFSPSGQEQPMTPEEWLQNGAPGFGMSYVSMINPNAANVTGALPDV